MCHVGTSCLVSGTGVFLVSATEVLPGSAKLEQSVVRLHRLVVWCVVCSVWFVVILTGAEHMGTPGPLRAPCTT